MEVHERADAERSIKSVGTDADSVRYELLTVAPSNN